MVDRRDFGLLLVSTAAAAASGEALAQNRALSSSFLMTETGTVTLARNPFGSNGVPSGPLWQINVSGESLYTFEAGGKGSVRGSSIFQTGVIYDQTIRNNNILAAEMALFDYKFIYTIDSKFNLKIFVDPGTFTLRKIQGPRKGDVEKIFYDSGIKTPQFVGYLNGQRFFLRNPNGSYFKRRLLGKPDLYGFRQMALTPTIDAATSSIGYNNNTLPPNLIS